MKLYIGSHDYKPDDYLTLDIDSSHNPDIVADAADMPMVESGSVDEVYASHILEHIPWPRSVLAISEWARVLRVGGVLKVAVPDLQFLCSLIARGINVYHAVALVYGVGRLENAFEAHQYGYTGQMLAEIFSVLGFGALSSWESNIPDAANGWMITEGMGRAAISLNVVATKEREPWCDPKILVNALGVRRMDSFLDVALSVASEHPIGQVPELDTALVQHLHWRLIEARQRIAYLEDRGTPGTT